MLLALAGVTGIGKTFLAEEIERELSFKKIHTIRTREIRNGEINGKTGFFISTGELEKLKNNGKIIYDFEVFENRYAYLKDEILEKGNHVLEIYYTTIYEWKEIVPEMKTIYILPTNIEKAIEKLKERNLEKSKEEKRIAEIKEQYKEFINNKSLQKEFDYIVYNDYTKESRDKIINLIKTMM